MPTCWAMVPKTSPLLRGSAETPTFSGLVRLSFETARMDPCFPFFSIPHPPPPLWGRVSFPLHRAAMGREQVEGQPFVPQLAPRCNRALRDSSFCATAERSRRSAQAHQAYFDVAQVLVDLGHGRTGSEEAVDAAHIGVVLVLRLGTLGDPERVPLMEQDVPDRLLNFAGTALSVLHCSTPTVLVSHDGGAVSSAAPSMAPSRSIQPRSAVHVDLSAGGRRRTGQRPSLAPRFISFSLSFSVILFAFFTMSAGK